jgi:hypothetical protein
MPRPGPRRKMVGVKLSDEELAAVEARARAEGLVWAGEPNASEMIRIACAYLQHMPEGWRPSAPGATSR